MKKNPPSPAKTKRYATASAANTKVGEVQPADFLAELKSLRIQEHLTRFHAPAGAAQSVVTHEAGEFTHLCPFTGHPDFAKIHISFRPLEWCVELKALKLYLQAFRNVRIPYEALIPIIYDHLMDCLGFTPKTAKGRLYVKGAWNSRGGICSEVSIGSVTNNS